MPPADEPIPHTVAKLRLLSGVPAEIGRDRAWAAIRAFPPGLEPAFMGALWFWHDGDPAPRAPALHLVAERPAPDAPRLRYLNLFFDRFLGGSALLDAAPGWRRLDFLFSLPAGTRPLLVRAALRAGNGLTVADAGRLAFSDGAWRFQAAAAPPPALRTPEPPPLRPCFIGGAPKSGTTWMQMLLNQHPDVFAAGEGELLRHVSMRPYFPKNRWFPPGSAQAALDHFATHAVLVRLFQTYREMTGCGWIADKSPGNARIGRQLLAYLPQAQLIHCVRHPLDALISRLHHEASIVAGGAVSHEMRHHAAAIADLPALLAGGLPLRFGPAGWAVATQILDEYAAFQTEALELLRARPRRLLVVRYEDMLRDGEACAARAFAHLGVAADAAQAAACVRRVSFANLRDRRGGRPHSFFRSGTSGQYAAALTPEDQARAMAHLAARLPGLSELGYAHP